MSPGKDVIDYFYKHIVPLLFTFQKEEKYQNLVITAFVLSVSEQWFLITAGHCITEIENIRENGYKLVRCKIIDSFGIEAVHKQPIPFPYDTVPHSCLSDDCAFDYGVIKLTTYYKNLLLQNNVRALDEEAWKKQPVNVDFYVLLGIPAELVKTESVNVSITPTLHKVEPLDDKPEGFSDVGIPLFYGHILLGDGIESMKGLSGGPIFAFHKNKKGEVRYWLTALQSRCLPDSQYIAACPTKLLGEFLESLSGKE
jgi:hypothetical protein